ncbi:MAG: iron-containing alcohol dehydrogenase [Clostridia bacterium]|nr:iron-containing alcohol dehydrogenase [Clostridia bacterium]
MPMDIAALVGGLQNCPCGMKHAARVPFVSFEKGLTERTGAILRRELGGENLFLVWDENTKKASPGLEESLASAGYRVKLLTYKNLRNASLEVSEEVMRGAGEADLILSAGTGSLNDVCRYASFRLNKPFAIFATAPSMDGFLSGQAPLTVDGFKTTLEAKPPEVLLADVDVLAASPAALKAAGLGDLLGKYTALADWRISSLLTGEAFCPEIARLTREAVGKAVRPIREGADPARDADYALALMEALTLSGLMIYLAGSSRPASGAEHHISHLWEMLYAARGLAPLYHGTKVGVAAAIVSDIYYKATETPPRILRHTPSRNTLEEAFHPLTESILRESQPDPAAEIGDETLVRSWDEISRIVREEIPRGSEIRALLASAGGAASAEEAGIPPEMIEAGEKYAFYVRKRLTLMRLLRTRVAPFSETEA